MYELIDEEHPEGFHPDGDRPYVTPEGILDLVQVTSEERRNAGSDMLVSTSEIAI